MNENTRAEHSADERRAGRRKERRGTLQRGEGDRLQVHVGEAEHPFAALEEIEEPGPALGHGRTGRCALVGFHPVVAGDPAL